MTLTPTILRFDSIDSTNLEAMRQAKSGAPQGLCIVAREQTRGRGRLDRTWQSPKDAGLYFSIILRPKIEMRLWPLLNLMSALAVAEALFKTYALPVDIKWPNDVYVNDRKICGILAETVESPDGPATIVGIGINLSSKSLPDELREQAISIEEATGCTPDRELLLTTLIQAIAERYEVLQADDGSEHTIREWCANSSFAFDRQVRISTNDNSFAGITRGLESDGALRVETAGGEIKIVRAGDVTALRALPATPLTTPR